VVAPDELARTVEPGWLVQGGAWMLGRIPELERPAPRGRCDPE
jgi:hypothetical protein